MVDALDILNKAFESQSGGKFLVLHKGKRKLTQDEIAKKTFQNLSHTDFWHLITSADAERAEFRQVADEVQCVMPKASQVYLMVARTDTDKLHLVDDRGARFKVFSEICNAHNSVPYPVDEGVKEMTSFQAHFLSKSEFHAYCDMKKSEAANAICDTVDVKESEPANTVEKAKKSGYLWRLRTASIDSPFENKSKFKDTLCIINIDSDSVALHNEFAETVVNERIPQPKASADGSAPSDKTKIAPAPPESKGQRPLKRKPVQEISKKQKIDDVSPPQLKVTISDHVAPFFNLRVQKGQLKEACNKLLKTIDEKNTVPLVLTLMQAFSARLSDMDDTEKAAFTQTHKVEIQTEMNQLKRALK